jgi:dihydrofolate reductase
MLAPRVTEERLPMIETADGGARRPQCSVYIAISLDGYIARPDGGLDWLSSFEQSGEDYGYKAFFSSVDVLVIGRKTYDVVLGFEKWPYEDKRCVVVTHTPRQAAHGETFHAGPLPALVDRLGGEGARRIYVDGGALIRGFLAADLIDDVTLSVIPVLLGAGIPLFGGVERRMKLVSHRSFPSGLVQLCYNLEHAPIA